MNLIESIRADVARSRPRKGSAIVYDGRVHTLITDCRRNGTIRAACSCRWVAADERHAYADVCADHERHRASS